MALPKLSLTYVSWAFFLLALFSALYKDVDITPLSIPIACRMLLVVVLSSIVTNICVILLHFCANIRINTVFAKVFEENNYYYGSEGQVKIGLHQSEVYVKGTLYLEREFSLVVSACEREIAHAYYIHTNQHIGIT